MNKKSAWALLAGLLAAFVVTTAVDILLHVVHVYPPMNQPLSNALCALATAYRIPISIGGAWLTARLAPSRPLYHALLLGWLGTVVGSIGVVVTWNRNLGPHWYPIALAVLSLPLCWLGGRLYQRQQAFPEPRTLLDR